MNLYPVSGIRCWLNYTLRCDHDVLLNRYAHTMWIPSGRLLARYRINCRWAVVEEFYAAYEWYKNRIVYDCSWDVHAISWY